MVKKIIAMLSIMFTGVSILLISDLVSSQIVYSELDNTSMTVSYYISKNGGITDSIKQFVKKEADAKIYCADDACGPVKKGDTYTYIIEKDFTPIVLSYEVKSIKVRRSVVVGL